ncbi:hypothetical protein G7075_04625 [Phycicoccus sp. HDW14]|uniref:hypothetical protein n=1 Tax=Phycicoccus sp. HDW14 TaxID=2714941 RepID=UPI001409C30B|nr:hypothetical protein [Phycicoccus sp. HDW14]QIM20598.1 hypothetical protein G7075_04625 [Phycicoccus sp. HDW14]
MLDGGNREPDDADAEWRRLVDATWSTPSDRAEIDGILETAEHPQPGSRGRGPGSARTLLIVLVVLPLLVGLKVVAPDIPGWWDYLVHGDPTFRVGAGAPVVAPPKDGRVRAAVPVPDAPSSTEYSFLQLEPDGSPVMFNPCRTIHYVIHDPVGLGDAGRDAVTRAAAEMSMVTGLAFVFDGYTDEEPSKDRALTVPQYSTRWAPVLIAWSDPEETRAWPAGSSASASVARPGARTGSTRTSAGTCGSTPPPSHRDSAVTAGSRRRKRW